MRNKSTDSVPPPLLSIDFCVRFLLVSLLFASSLAAQLMDFPGSTFCLDDEIVIKKPKDVPQTEWQHLQVVDSLGSEVAACQILPRGSLLTIPEKCISHETGRRVAHISLVDSMNSSVIYHISCSEEQADAEYSETTIQCHQQYMMATILRQLSGFDDEVISTPPPPSEWSLTINNGSLVRVNMAAARGLGYTMTSDINSLEIRADFNAFGIRSYSSRGQMFYRGDISLIHERKSPRITIDIVMICAKGPPACNESHMTLSVPSEAGALQYIYIGNQAIPLTPLTLQQQGLTLVSSNGVLLSIAKTKLQVSTVSGKTSYYLPSLTLVFLVDRMSVPMELTRLKCLVTDSALASCTTDGFMMVQVFASSTKPSLDLDTVTVRDRTCLPQEKTDKAIYFRIPLNSCGTTKRYIGDQIMYENEISALWKNLSPRMISRDSELRETVWCLYDGSGLQTINGSVSTLPPPISPRSDGPLSIVLNLYPDVSYQAPYSVNQYPIVKTLRDPIFLEVQILNRNDPNLELVLDDCWATMSKDPNALPQWNVVVDGCKEPQDNYLTVFHAVDLRVPLATYRKRFEVKAFAFMQGGELSTNMVYFHCSAMICDITSPDSRLCTQSCLQGRKKRDELFLQRHSTLASLPGPVQLLDAEPSRSLTDEQDVIKQVTLGVLPAFALVALVILIAVLTSFKQKSKS
ncbi:zona pellucida sperm-binding protein 2 [Leptodactylus fuscus]|uniref:zona pellucida sperm-binding protein 2 n=1 Tax=Leptodactylus fuscus TaxID=238119 RepID=UPI003F4F1F1F